MFHGQGFGFRVSGAGVLLHDPSAAQASARRPWLSAPARGPNNMVKTPSQNTNRDKNPGSQPAPLPITFGNQGEPQPKNKITKAATVGPRPHLIKKRIKKFLQSPVQSPITPLYSVI